MSFTVGPIELEFAVELRGTLRPSRFKTWVVAGDVEAGAARAVTSRSAVIRTGRTGLGTHLGESRTERRWSGSRLPRRPETLDAGY